MSQPSWWMFWWWFSHTGSRFCEIGPATVSPPDDVVQLGPRVAHTTSRDRTASRTGPRSARRWARFANRVVATQVQLTRRVDDDTVADQ